MNTPKKKSRFHRTHDSEEDTPEDQLDTDSGILEMVQRGRAEVRNDYSAFDLTSTSTLLLADYNKGKSKIFCIYIIIARSNFIHFLVPIFDGRNTRFSFKKLARLGKKLPLFKGEVPANSAAVVAYTMYTYRKKTSDVVLCCGLQWIIVLATP